MSTLRIVFIILLITYNTIICQQYNYICDFNTKFTANTVGSWIQSGCEVSQTTSNAQGAVTWLGADTSTLSWSDYTIESTFQITQISNGNVGCGLIFRASSISNIWTGGSYYYVALEPTQDIVYNVELNNGFRMGTSVPKTIELNTDYTLRVDVCDTTYQIYVDNTLMEIVSDNSYSTGSVGLRCYSAAATFKTLYINSTAGCTFSPTTAPTKSPAPLPTTAPTGPTLMPSKNPNVAPSVIPTTQPSMAPTLPIIATVTEKTPTPSPTLVEGSVHKSTDAKSVYTSAIIDDLKDNSSDETFAYVLYIGLVIIVCCICCLCVMVLKRVYKNSKEVQTDTRWRIPSLSVQKHLQNANGHKPNLVNAIKTSVSLKKPKNVKKLVEYMQDNPKEMTNVTSSSLPEDHGHMVTQQYSVSVEPFFGANTPGTMTNDPLFNAIRSKRSVSEYSHYAAQEIHLWLQTQVGLPQYFQPLIQNGYDTMEIIESMESKSCLDEIGIQLKGHQNRIWVEIKKLRVSHRQRADTTPSGQQNDGFDIQIMGQTMGNDMYDNDNGNDELYENNKAQPSTKDAEDMIETFDTPVGEGI